MHSFTFQHIPRRNESIEANMVQYSCADKYIDVIVADSSIPCWRSDVEFDCILADRNIEYFLCFINYANIIKINKNFFFIAPYGIREPTERIGSKESLPFVKKEASPIHFPSKVDYGLNEIVKDLMRFSSKQLKVNGRLLFWVPVFKQHYDETQIPRHSCFELIGNCEQVLTTFTARRLLIFEKIKMPQVN